jgi:dienelactone hydrolase
LPREADWARRWVDAGYAVLLVDSFNPRGMREICTIKAGERSIRAQDRGHDAGAAVAWLASQPGIDSRRIALVGWSHGAMSTLWAVSTGRRGAGVAVRAAIAFYPGCTAISRQQEWQTSVPTTLLLGSLDDWTPPAPCRELARQAGLRVVEYPGAYHGFDAPASPVRVRTGLGTTPTGTAHVGTDPAARAAAIIEVERILAAAFR